MIKAKVFVFFRTRVIAILEIVEGFGHLIIGNKMPSIVLKTMFWELQSAPWKNWQTENIFNVLNPPKEKD
jgi:hypothetical protein